MKQLLSLLVGLIALQASGQVRARDVVQLGLLSTGSIISLDYEHFFFKTDGERPLNLSAGIGLGLNEEFCVLYCGSTKSYMSVPHHVALNIKASPQGLVQIGMAGASISEQGAPPVFYRGYPMVAFRHMPLKRHRFAFQLRLSYPKNEGWEPWLTPPVGLYFGLTL